MSSDSFTDFNTLMKTLVKEVEGNYQMDYANFPRVNQIVQLLTDSWNNDTFVQNWKILDLISNIGDTELSGFIDDDYLCRDLMDAIVDFMAIQNANRSSIIKALYDRKCFRSNCNVHLKVPPFIIRLCANALIESQHVIAVLNAIYGQDIMQIAPDILQVTTVVKQHKEAIKVYIENRKDIIANVEKEHKNKITNLEDEIRKRDETLKSLLGDLEIARQRIMSLEGQQNYSTVGGLRTALEIEMVKTKTLEDEVRKQDEQLKTLLCKLEITEKNQKKEHNEDELQEQLNAAGRRYEEILNEQMNENQRLISANIASENHVEELTRELNNSSKSLDSLSAKFTEQEKQLADLKEQYTKNMDTVEKMTQEHKRSISMTNAALSAFESTNTELSSRVELLTIENTRLKNQLESQTNFEKQIAEKNAEIEQLSAKLLSYKTATSKLSEEFKKIVYTQGMTKTL